MNTRRPKGSSGTARAARSLLLRQLAGAKRIEAVLKPEGAAALADLRKRTGRTYSAIIEGLLLAQRARDLRRPGNGLHPEAAGGERLPLGPGLP
ncbi:MAG: hypothetical protein M3461_18205 [Pseudomonadota bacterium]|nr:hypothetical protein [Pseudomonadota bacterium]